MKRNYNCLISGLVVTIFLFTLFSGCAGQKHAKQEKKDAFFDKWKVRAEESKGQSPVIQRRIIAVPENKVAKPEQKLAVEVKQSLPTQEISMSMHNVDLAVLVRTLARAVNIPIVINESVKGKANLSIQKQPWDQVFRAILESNGLTYSWVGDIIRIMTLEDRELDLKRELQEQSFKTLEPLAMSVVEIHYAKAEDLKENLKALLTKNDKDEVRGSINVDSHTNSLIIHAINSDIDRMITLIQELDRPTRQVLIEAHIVQARKEIRRELGIYWSGTRYTGGGGGSANDRIPTATGTTFDAATTNLSGLALGYYTQKLGKYALDAQLSALEIDQKVNVLSSPSITTQDNQKAIIESGKQVPYNIKDEAGNTTTEFKDAALKLEVTPHTIDLDTLSLIIKIKKDEVDPDPLSKVNGVPSLIKKYAETRVIVFDGQTTVIGGLNEENKDNTDRGVPILKDIPLLGYLFKGTDSKNQMDDLLIFITPYILKERPIAEESEISPESMAPIEQPAVPGPQPE